MQKKKDSPVARAYQLYLKNRLLRPSWDQVALIYAVEPEAEFWNVTKKGFNQIFKEGTNHWHSEPDDKRHNLVQVKRDMQAKLTVYIDELMAHNPVSKVKNKEVKK